MLSYKSPTRANFLDREVPCLFENRQVPCLPFYIVIISLRQEKQDLSSLLWQAVTRLHTHLWKREACNQSNKETSDMDDVYKHNGSFQRQQTSLISKGSSRVNSSKWCLNAFHNHFVIKEVRTKDRFFWSGIMCPACNKDSSCMICTACQTLWSMSNCWTLHATHSQDMRNNKSLEQSCGDSRR